MPNLSFFGAIALLVLLALELADRVTMKRDLEIAKEIQTWLMPAAPPQVFGIEMAFATRPANTVAGDYYDAFLRPVDADCTRVQPAVASRGRRRSREKRPGSLAYGDLAGKPSYACGGMLEPAGSDRTLKSLCVRTKCRRAAFHDRIPRGIGLRYPATYVCQCGTQLARTAARLRRNRTSPNRGPAAWPHAQRPLRMRTHNASARRRFTCLHRRPGRG